MSDEDGEQKRAVALRRVRKFVESYVAKGAYELYPEPEVVENIVQGLTDNLVAHGKMYCPCAEVESSKARGAEMVCPCTPHHADIARQGYCDCALFASPSFVAEERLRKGKPA
ncbi:MAG: hypothetical protein KF819_15060 [Labilithrix sp.]|nr:hypothetical protein [Labilithrix sp.]